MGNWERQQEAKTEAREKERLSREVLGKFFYDLAKLTDVYCNGISGRHIIDSR